MAGSAHLSAAEVSTEVRRWGTLRSAVTQLRVLLVEDDEGDAFLVRELLLDADSDVELVRARSLAEATSLSRDRFDCILLDLGLPDATGLRALSELLETAPGTAVIVLTGLADEHRGTEAVASGAQDYLVKGAIDGQLLTRSVRYAVERKRADESVRRLYASEVRAAENARLERGLLPQPLVSDRVDVVSSYRPGGHQAVLGGDFFDVVERPDGTVFAVIGDVAGHGPDEAALGVCLRIAWRTLVLSGADPDAIFSAMHDVLVSERTSEEVFATAAMVRVVPSAGACTRWLAGHPAPLLLGRGGEVHPGPDIRPGLALGVQDGHRWVSATHPVQAGSRLLLYTDGLIEGFHAPGSRSRLGDEGLHEVLRTQVAAGVGYDELLDRIISAVTERNGDDLSDDVAVLMLAWTGR